MARKVSKVYRHLDVPTRFSRFDVLDVSVLVSTHGLVGGALELLGLGPSYFAFTVTVPTAVGLYIIRSRFEGGLSRVVSYLRMDKHLSALAKDRGLLGYPPGRGRGVLAAVKQEARR